MTEQTEKPQAGRRNWARLALTLGQLGLMGTSLVLSLSLGYAGDLVAVGAVAPAMLVFQLTCGVLQRSLAEATLLRSANTELAAERPDCQWSVAAALSGGLVGAAAAVAAALMVPAGSLAMSVAYAAGIPFAIALDIGRSAGVAAGKARSVFVETAAWSAVQLVLMLAFAAAREPVYVCLSWTAVNAAFFLAAARHPDRRPVFAGLLAWVRSQRNGMGAASLDAFLVGLTPVLALQVTVFVAEAATLGVIRIVQQLFGPLAFVSITLRRVLVYQRKVDVSTTRRQDFRDGMLALALMGAGSLALGGAVLVGSELLPAMSFIPVGFVLLAAWLEKAALGFSYGCSLSRFVRGEFKTLLRARYVMLCVTVLVAPLMTVGFGASGYLVGSALGMVVYSVVVIALPAGERPQSTLLGSGAKLS